VGSLDHGPVRYYVLNRADKKGTFLFAASAQARGTGAGGDEADLDSDRDGLTMHGYLTLPAGVLKNLPMVLFVHGALSRDVWGYNSYAQWFANRGYACLQVNQHSRPAGREKSF
jgi:dipeptidyl aminopeptidase/acylaminoacyl peptidase